MTCLLVPKYKYCFRVFCKTCDVIFRQNSRISKSSKPLKLSYSIYENQATSDSACMIIHGLFGAKQNWQSLAKRFAKLGHKVITLDLRNHGDSPHSDVMTYQTMTEDVIHLLEDLNLSQVSLLGHSLGGKIAMYFALTKPDLVKKLVVVDISPVSLSAVNSHSNLQYAQFFQQVNLKPGVPLHENRKNADSQLKQNIQDVGVINFALTNLIQSDESTRWRLNLDSIIANYDEIASFPNVATSYNGPTIFIGGQSSTYISDETIPKIKQLFPNSKITHIANAGHWVHADQPEAFVQVVHGFLQKS